MTTEPTQPQTARRQQVIAADQLDRLIERSDRKGLLRLFQQLAALAIAAFLMVKLEAVSAAVAGLGYGVLLVFLFCPLHESIHQSLFASPWLNKATGFVCGLIVMLPPRYFNAFHMAHHRYTQIPGKDPELLTPTPETLGQYLYLISGIHYWRAQISSIVSLSLGKHEPLIAARRRQSVINEARLFLLIYLLLAIYSVIYGSLVFWWFWLLPVLVAQPFLRLFLMAEHTDCPEVEDMFANTRTTYTGPAMQWLVWNMNLHTAHHAYTGIPFFRLPEATRMIESHIIESAPGYLRINLSIVNTIRS